MYCKCSKPNTINIVGLCDPNSFSTEETAAWTQITIPEILTLPECYPNIESIEKIYINVSINDTHIIRTPNPTPPITTNEENTLLTGKKLIVSGNLCETILYTAKTSEQEIHSLKYIYPFCTEIMLDSCTNMYTNFCIKSCIENVYSKLLNERTILKNVTFFLLAVPESTSYPLLITSP